MTTESDITPIFLLSLPRSGSTLLQRMIASHSEIATASEPWLLLPMLSVMRATGTYADYNFRSAKQAIGEFLSSLPSGDRDYETAVRTAAEQLYFKACSNGERFFLDKTPRYSLIAAQLLSTFPEGKFIFLWRNPLSVLSSIVETFGENKWKIHAFKIDLFEGLDHLIAAGQMASGQAIFLRYEDLVVRPELEIEHLCSYLDIAPEQRMTTSMGNGYLEGSFGDQMGKRSHRDLSGASINRWQEILNNPLRKRWARRYLLQLGSERLSFMGYDIEDLLSQLDSTPITYKAVGKDVCWSIYGALWSAGETHQTQMKLGRIGRGHPYYAHN
jgi:hypothetical protein